MENASVNLEFCTDNDLWFELRKRFGAAVLIAIAPEPTKNAPFRVRHLMYTSGYEATCRGLLAFGAAEIDSGYTEQALDKCRIEDDKE